MQIVIYKAPPGWTWCLVDGVQTSPRADSLGGRTLIYAGDYHNKKEAASEAAEIFRRNVTTAPIEIHGA